MLLRKGIRVLKACFVSSLFFYHYWCREWLFKPTWNLYARKLLKSASIALKKFGNQTVPRVWGVWTKGRQKHPTLSRITSWISHLSMKNYICKVDRSIFLATVDRFPALCCLLGGNLGRAFLTKSERGLQLHVALVGYVCPWLDPSDKAMFGSAYDLFGSWVPCERLVA